MAKYAERTSVPQDRSRSEIERTLTRYGADQFAYGWDETGGSLVAFRMHGRQVRFVVPFPSRTEREFTHTPTGQRRSAAQIEAQWEQACRQRWRALALVIKAKMEAVESGIVDFESEFLAHIALPNGTTVGEMMHPQLEAVYETGQMPPMLTGMLALDSGAGQEGDAS